MEIFFRNKKLQKQCSNQKDARGKLGPVMARKLQQRMMELQDAECLEEMASWPMARCHELSGNRKG